METLLRGASPGVKRGRVEVVKYASRREIYTAVSNLDARNARTGPDRGAESRNRVLWRMRGYISTQPSNISERLRAS